MDKTEALYGVVRLSVICKYRCAIKVLTFCCGARRGTTFLQLFKISAAAPASAWFV